MFNVRYKDWKSLSEDLYFLDEENKTFFSAQSSLYIECDDEWVISCGDECSIGSGNECSITAKSDCLIQTGVRSTISSFNGSYIKTGSYCTMFSGIRTLFDVGDECMISTTYIPKVVKAGNNSILKSLEHTIHLIPNTEIEINKYGIMVSGTLMTINEYNELRKLLKF